MLLTIIILSIILALLITFIIVSNIQIQNKIKQAKEDGANDCFNMILQIGYDNRVNNFKGLNKNVKEGGIVFVGDSLTENYNVYEYFKNYNVFNRGIGGDTTEGLLKRMNESIFDLNPKVVILLIGINDFELVKNSTPTTIASNIELIVNMICQKLPNTKIILESVYHVCKIDNKKIDKASINKKDNEKVDEVNKIISTLGNVEYIDMNKYLCDDKKNLKLEYTIEGLHINNTGYEIITKVLKEKIDKLV